MEKRSSYRITVSLPGYLIWRSLKMPVHVVNISGGGACLLVETQHFQKIGKGDVLEGAIAYRDEEIPFKGHICWATADSPKTQAGLSFTEKSPGITKMLLALNPDNDDSRQEDHFNL